MSFKNCVSTSKNNNDNNMQLHPYQHSAFPFHVLMKRDETALPNCVVAKPGPPKGYKLEAYYRRRHSPIVDNPPPPHLPLPDTAAVDG